MSRLPQLEAKLWGSWETHDVHHIRRMLNSAQWTPIHSLSCNLDFVLAPPSLPQRQAARSHLIMDNLDEVSSRGFG